MTCFSKGDYVIRAKFYCDIYNKDGVLLQESFDFDTGEFESLDEMKKYCKREGYVIGEPCGMWGSDKGILTEILTNEDV